MINTRDIADNLIAGKAAKVKELVQQAINEGIPPDRILKEGLIAGMDVVGAKFKANEFYIPEVLVAAKAMKNGMALLKPLLAKGGVKPVAKFAIGTVQGDLHDIGKNLVAMMMEGAGFEVIDAGIDTTPEKFIQIIKEKQPELIGMSALLTTTMPSMRVIMDEIRKAGVRDRVKVMIGGAPITQEYCNAIGADGYTGDAASAVDKAKELLKT